MMVGKISKKIAVLGPVAFTPEFKKSPYLEAKRIIGLLSEDENGVSEVEKRFRCSRVTLFLPKSSELKSTVLHFQKGITPIQTIPDFR